MRDFGRLDGAANVAGVFPTIGGIVDTSDEEWDRVVGVNAGGVYVSPVLRINACIWYPNANLCLLQVQVPPSRAETCR